jgi:single-stranded-DNA-specific exonuclease
LVAKRYKIRAGISDEAHETLREYSPLQRALLSQRGVRSAEEAEKFLKPDYYRDLHDPILMKDMERAVERVVSAVENNERVIIYADYDCDGIPGAVILYDFFEKIGVKAEVYIPHRYSDSTCLHLKRSPLWERGF